MEENKDNNVEEQAPVVEVVEDTESEVEENQEVTEASELLKAQEEAGQFKDKYMRSVAEMENLKRRHEKQKADAIKFGFRIADEKLTSSIGWI